MAGWDVPYPAIKKGTHNMNIITTTEALSEMVSHYLTQEVEFETVSQLESYLSYNRANIVELELSGKLGA